MQQARAKQAAARSKQQPSSSRIAVAFTYQCGFLLLAATVLLLTREWFNVRARCALRNTDLLLLFLIGTVYTTTTATVRTMFTYAYTYSILYSVEASQHTYMCWRINKENQSIVYCIIIKYSRNSSVSCKMIHCTCIYILFAAQANATIVFYDEFPIRQYITLRLSNDDNDCVDGVFRRRIFLILRTW